MSNNAPMTPQHDRDELEKNPITFERMAMGVLIRLQEADPTSKFNDVDASSAYQTIYRWLDQHYIPKSDVAAIEREARMSGGISALDDLKTWAELHQLDAEQIMDGIEHIMASLDQQLHTTQEAKHE